LAPAFPKTAILGVGLIGASLALALKRKGISEHISGYGRKAENLRKARALEILDSHFLSAKEAVKGADLVVLATPVGRFSEIAAEIRDSLKRGSIQMDVGSVKGDLVYELEKMLPRFVGCHPIAGGERSGVEPAKASLFEGMRCIITKTASTDEEAFNRVKALWESIGSRVRLMDPAEHDRVFALVSHLPHAAAYALVNTVGDVDPALINMAGAGLKDATRIAASSPEMWSDILMLNRDNVLEFIGLLHENLSRIEDAMRSGDRTALQELLSKARALRKSVEN
jgi:prephenate dehydrogenase